MKNYIWKAFSRLIILVEFQLFIMLISLPVLIAWGLPISLLSIIGNSLFTPFLAAILLLSSILFFCELCYCSNTYCATALDYLLYWWSTLMSFGNSSYLVPYKKPPLFILFLFFTGIVLVVHYSIRKPRIQRIVIYTLFLLIFSFANNMLLSPQVVHYIPYNNNSLTLITTPKKQCLIDPGLLASRGNVSSFVEYALTQSIIQTTGRLTLDAVIIAKPSKSLLGALKKLLMKFSVKTIYIPSLKGYFSKPFYKARKDLEEYAHSRNCIITYYTNECILDLGDYHTIRIIPTGRYKKIDTGSYGQAKITGQIDNTSFTSYSP